MFLTSVIHFTFCDVQMLFLASEGKAFLPRSQKKDIYTQVYESGQIYLLGELLHELLRHRMRRVACSPLLLLLFLFQYIYFYLDIFVFPRHPGQQVKAGGCPRVRGLLEVSSNERVFPGHCRVMFALEESLGFPCD